MSSGKYWDDTFNPCYGCSHISPACDHCYAEDMIETRWKNNPLAPVHDFKPTWYEKAFEKRLSGNVIFVCNMSDLFHETFTDEQILRVLGYIGQHRDKTFLILTKRAERLQNFNFSWYPNLWVGVTVENQAMADYRIPLLFKCNAVNRWVSAEPLLEEISIADYFMTTYEKRSHDTQLIMPSDESAYSDSLDWLVVGCESGTDRRKNRFTHNWLGCLLEDASYCGLHVFVKQLEINGKVTSKLNKFPESLRVRELPDNFNPKGN